MAKKTTQKRKSKEKGKKSKSKIKNDFCLSLIALLQLLIIRKIFINFLLWCYCSWNCSTRDLALIFEATSRNHSESNWKTIRNFVKNSRRIIKFHFIQFYKRRHHNSQPHSLFVVMLLLVKLFGIELKTIRNFVKNSRRIIKFHFIQFYKRRHPESNGEAQKGSGLKPDAIPLCDGGLILFR